MIQPGRQASVVAALLGLAAVAPASGQQAPASAGVSSASCGVSTRAPAPTAESQGSPLERRIAFHATGISLTEALDRLATAAGIRLSYSRELLPANRNACVTAASATVGDVLAHLLRGSELEPVEAGDTHIVLRRRPGTPTPARANAVDSAAQVQQLAAVLVTATAASVDARPWSAASVTTIDAAAIAKRDVRSLADILQGSTPGVWVWDQPPSAFLTQYGSLRGASSFGASSPKIYIDGIEVANPLLVTLLDPEHIDRIELVRGPQGAALYGVDALSGVVNITTRHDGAADGGLDVHMRSSGGVVESRYATSPLIAQNHSITVRAGSGARSFALSLAGDETGSYLPGAGSRQLNALATAQRIGTHAVLGLTARLASVNATSPSNQLLVAGLGSADTGGNALVRSALRQYTLGLTAEVLPIGRWRHSFVAGIDGYRFLDDAASGNAVPAGLAQMEIPEGADRLSARASSVYRLIDSDRTTTMLTFGAEHVALRQASREPLDVPTSALIDAPLIDWRSNTGLSAQLDATLHQHLFLTGGLRMERLAFDMTVPRIVALPMIGAGIVGSREDFTLTMRGAYGRGIRAPRTSQLDPVARHGQRMMPRGEVLLPEEQEGTEASVRLAKGKAFSLQLTRFDQLASGLVQSVAFSGRDGHRMELLRNVGEIANRGWELEQALDVRGVTVSSTLSLIDSRVRAVADGYDGELRAGDRMLEVPAMTVGVNVGYSFRRGSLAVGLSHARDWVGYDMLALHANGGATGSSLRDYWRNYSSVTGLRASASRDITRSLRLVLTGDNLLDVQRGAPDNATLLPGRTTTLSLRAVF